MVVFVSRHRGASDWALRKGLRVDRTAAHLDAETVSPGDIVVGSLPVHVAAQVCERGGRYFHLTLDVPEAMRGTELSAEQMERAGARLEEYRVERLEERA